jgi:hypothetical protein
MITISLFHDGGHGSSLGSCCQVSKVMLIVRIGKRWCIQFFQVGRTVQPGRLCTQQQFKRKKPDKPSRPKLFACTSSKKPARHDWLISVVSPDGTSRCVFLSI